MDGCQFKVYADPGTDDQGNIENSSGDIFLCVYSVTDPQTVKFLEDKVLPKLSDSEKVIAGLGLENRTANSAKVVPKDTASRLGRQFKCDSMELVSCDGVSSSLPQNFKHLMKSLFLLFIVTYRIS